MKPLDPFAAGRTLFYSIGNTAALLVERRGRRRQQKQMRFDDAHQALTWCMENATGFVCLPPNLRGTNN